MNWQSSRARLALLELHSRKTLRRRRSQSEAFDALSELPWTRATSRRNELALVVERGTRLTELLSRVWPDWRSELADLEARGLKPTPEGYKRLGDARRAESVPQLPPRINRRTAAAILAPNSKSSLAGGRRTALDRVETTHDGAIRLRPPEAITLQTTHGSLNISEVARILGEASIPERAFMDGLSFRGTIRAALLVENLGAWRDVPRVPGWLVAHVPGWDTQPGIHLLQALPSTPFVHFGDIDPNGVKIYRHLKESRPDLLWFLPCFWFESAGRTGLKATWPEDLDLSDAPKSVRELARRGLMLEQESIVIDPRLPDALENTLQDRSGN